MLLFHAPRSLIEHPALLCDGLRPLGIALQLDNTSRAGGQIDGTALSLEFRPKRFVANLAVAIDVPLASVAMPMPPDEYLATLKAFLNRHEATATLITNALASLNISRIDSPVDSEVAYARRQCHDPWVDETVCKIHQLQKLMAMSIDGANFEAAAYRSDQLQYLLNVLYEYCECRLKRHDV